MRSPATTSKLKGGGGGGFLSKMPNLEHMRKVTNESFNEMQKVQEEGEEKEATKELFVKY